MDIIRNHDAGARLNNLKAFEDLILCEVIRHGIFRKPEDLSNLKSVYDRFLKRTPIDDRKRIYAAVVELVGFLGGATAVAFNPFMLLDTDLGIVSTATIDYASLGELIDGDPMTRPRDIVNMITNGTPRNPAAVVGGLLSLGDPRVCALVAPIRHHLQESEIETVSKVYTGITYKCVVDFYLDWLQDLRSDEGIFGHVAAGLYRLGNSRIAPSIVDGLRPFPFNDSAAQSSVRAIEPSHFAESISPRLYALEANERAPKVIPHVIMAFGLTPKSSPESWMMKG